MNILGLKIEGHDPGAALITSSGVVAIAEERLNRVKHSQGLFPSLAISYCLDRFGLKPSEVDLIVIDHTSRKTGSNIRELFYSKTGDVFAGTRLEVVSHHEAHAASAFFCSPFDDAAVLVYDGRGSMLVSEVGVSYIETESLFRGTANRLSVIDKVVHTPLKVIGVPQVFGIGMLYDRMCAEYVSFGRHDHGKLMGLAAYGDDRLLLKYPISRWVTESNGQVVCNGDWRFTRRKVKHPSQRLKTRIIRVLVGIRDYVVATLRVIILLLQRRKDDIHIFEPIVFEMPARDPNTHNLPDKHYASAAFAAQKIFEHFSTNLAVRLKEVTHSNNLCVSGGCALNIDANRNFLTKAGFKDLFVQPASSDCGIALGCALWGKHVVLKQPRDWVMRSASLGRKYSSKEIDAAIQERKDEIQWKVSANIAKDAAKLIADGKIIGWFQGGAEYGPRALGNRSILCDASIKDMRDILNSRVKHREMWRPFATSILAEYLEEWFDLKPNSATGFMLLAAEIPKEKRALVPAIVHVDNTCRMQTVTKEDNGIYYDLIDEFRKLRGIPLVLNTSFNLGGEPIVETPRDSIDTFLRTNMDYLVLEDRIVWKHAK